MTESIIVIILAAAFDANRDAISHKGKNVIYARMRDSALKRWILRGSNARATIPAFIKRIDPIYSFVKGWWDGRHASKQVIVLSVCWGLSSTWLHFFGLYVLFGGIFYVLYHIILDQTRSWKDSLPTRT